MENNTLTHHGILGMRWGIRRYQNADGSLTAAGKKRQKKQQAKNLEKARKARAEKKKQEELTAEKRQKILKSRSAKDLYDNAHLFTTKELQDAHFRLQLEKNIKDLQPKDINNGKSKTQKAAEAMGNLANVIDKGSTLYNNIAKVHNAFSDNKWNTIGGERKSKEREAIEEIIKSGTPDEIGKYFGKLSAKDYGNIKARFAGEDFVRERMKKKSADTDETTTGDTSEPKKESFGSRIKNSMYRFKINRDKSNGYENIEVRGEGRPSRTKPSDKWWKDDNATIYDVPGDTIVYGQNYVAGLLGTSTALVPKEYD